MKQTLRKNKKNLDFVLWFLKPFATYKAEKSFVVEGLKELINILINEIGFESMTLDQMKVLFLIMEQNKFDDTQQGTYQLIHFLIKEADKFNNVRKNDTRQ